MHGVTQQPDHERGPSPSEQKACRGVTLIARKKLPLRKFQGEKRSEDVRWQSHLSGPALKIQILPPWGKLTGLLLHDVQEIVTTKVGGTGMRVLHMWKLGGREIMV